MEFPEWFLRWLVFGALGLSSCGAITLLWLLLRDSKAKKLW